MILFWLSLCQKKHNEKEFFHESKRLYSFEFTKSKWILTVSFKPDGQKEVSVKSVEVKLRFLRREDFDAVVEIDNNVLGEKRTEYYQDKFNRALDSRNRIVTSLVAEEQGCVVGFVMSELYRGEYGIPSTEAAIDTIGIHPEFQRSGVGSILLKAVVDHLKKAGVLKVYALVEWDDAKMVPFFSAYGFHPSPTINLEFIL